MNFTCSTFVNSFSIIIRFQRRVLWAAGLCFTADSTEIMLLSFLSLTLQSEWGLTPNQTASMTACVFAGSLVGTLTFGKLGDHWGRRPTFLLACLCISVFGVLTAFATDYASLLGIRFMVGFGVGGITVPFDVFAEFLPTHARGKHLLIIEYFWTAGSMMTPLFAYWTLHDSWRFFVILCALPCVMSGILGAFLCPESPRWLVSVGRDEEAMQILRSAAATNGLNPDDVFKADVKLKDEHVEKTSNFTDLVSKKWRKISILLWITWIGYAIGYYGTVQTVTRVFDAGAVDGAEAGGTPEFDYKSIFISASAEIFGLVVVIQTIDTIGRVYSQVMSFLIGGIFVFTLGMISSTGSTNVAALTALAFVARACMMAGSCSTWVTTAELYSTEIRTSGHSVANALGRCGAFASPYLVRTSIPISSVGGIMLAINVVTAFSAFHLPETKGTEMGHVEEENTTTASISEAEVPPIV